MGRRSQQARNTAQNQIPSAPEAVYCDSVLAMGASLLDQKGWSPPLDSVQYCGSGLVRGRGAFRKLPTGHAADPVNRACKVPSLGRGTGPAATRLRNRRRCAASGDARAHPAGVDCIAGRLVAVHAKDGNQGGSGLQGGTQGLVAVRCLWFLVVAECLVCLVCCSTTESMEVHTRADRAIGSVVWERAVSRAVQAGCQPLTRTNTEPTQPTTRQPAFASSL